MTDTQRVERARRAEMARVEFIEPAFTVVDEAYSSRLEQLCATEPWSAQKISSLANSRRILKEVYAQVCGVIRDGEVAKAEMIRAEKIEKLSPEKRKWAAWAPL